MNNLMQFWLPTPTKLTLFVGEVHVWKIDLKSSDTQLLRFRETLSRDEINRAERFYFPEHRQRFIVGRGSLRHILGRYLDVEPAQVKFDYQSRGKPVLADQLAKSDLFFNLAHSQDLALCAVNYMYQIGIDIEHIHPVSDLENLAQRFFLPEEYALLRSLPLEQKQNCFFRYWTCKEAYLKATGNGLAELEQVRVCLAPDKPAKLIGVDEWNLRELVPADGFAGAIAIAGNCQNLQFWQYE